MESQYALVRTDTQTSLYYIDGGEKLRRILGEEPLLPLTEWVVSHSKALTAKEIDEVSALFFFFFLSYTVKNKTGGPELMTS